MAGMCCSAHIRRPSSGPSRERTNSVGAEYFLAGGAPWWFGFHAVPGLAETVVEGNEARYIDWFPSTGTLGDGERPPIRDAFVRAYTGCEALRCAFAYYRALPETAAQIERAVATARLAVPTMAIGSHPVPLVFLYALLTPGPAS